ncbi:hypothetical protein [Nostoc sp. FACHB-110]|uniref:hypothetical protein n=1 Tax=Nostoc sp. FACHB-110 TaxID=2692834 RepID=UPI001687C8D6|nr:hypothetical protein [Nostoc sp. FACHB-110]MBD2438870.1 hypothetical protein [Nostoc sp. FACHB-110]
MPGTDTRTGSRSTNPYIQKLQNLQTRSSQSETPERFLQTRYDPSQLLRISQQAARDDSLSQQASVNQNRNSELSRQKELTAFNNSLQEQSKTNDLYRQVSLQKNTDGNKSYTTSVSYNEDGVIFTPRQDGVISQQLIPSQKDADFNRQKELMQLQNQQDLANADRARYNQQLINQQNQAHERTQQAAQLAAQQRLAQMQQDTAILIGNPGESTWRWF